MVPGVSNDISGRKEKPITSVTGILADINSGDKIKKVLKLPFNPSHFLDDKCSTNKQLCSTTLYTYNPRWQVLRPVGREGKCLIFKAYTPLQSLEAIATTYFHQCISCMGTLSREATPGKRLSSYCLPSQ